MNDRVRNEIEKLGRLCELAARSAVEAVASGNEALDRRVAMFHLKSAQLYSQLAFKAAQA